jgi:hypothetical protein
MNQQDFISSALELLKSDGFNVRLINAKSKDGCAGWFGDDTKEFIVCKKHRFFYDVFVHEFCHYKQWKYSKTFWDVNSPGYVKFLRWLEFEKEYSDATVDKLLINTMSIELDCETLACQMVKDLDLDIDTEMYCRRANAYIWSYHFYRSLRKNTQRTLYVDKLLDLMPTEMKPLSYYFNLGNLGVEAGKILASRFK